ncbi:MAG: GerMN domain-containing protein [Coriobacteriia bacterium]|nr:GerMN domain-containing protein [Coriobacteriia bacterium]
MRTRPALATLAALTLALALTAGCGPRDAGNGTDRGSDGTTPSADATPAADGEDAAGRGTPIRAYFLREAGSETGRQERVAPVRRHTRSTGVAAAAVEALLAGPNEAEATAGFVSAVPSGVRLRGVNVRNGIAIVDLSDEFAAGAGSAGMRGRVAQLVYTLTQFGSVDGVELRIEGERVTELGAEGLLLQEPQTREDWEGLTPIVLVEEPAFGDTLDSPLRVTGTANTFEAEFRLEVTADGRTLADRQVMATSGSGTRGTFVSTLRFDASEAGTYKLTAWYASAKDGSRVEVFDLTGAGTAD